MKNQELLRAIRNADQKYYEEAEQRIHHRKEITMKSNIIRRFMSGTAVAAAVALTAFCGLKIYRSSANQPIVNTTPGKAGSTPTVQAGDENAINYLGGHGSLLFSAAGNTMLDRDNLYIAYGAYAAKRDSEESVMQTPNRSVVLDPAEQESFMVDHARGGLYTQQNNTGLIFKVSEDGTKTPLNASFAAADRQIFLYSIVQLSDTRYYVEGHYRMKQEPENAEIRDFWQIFDTETGVVAGDDDADYTGIDRVFYDGNDGVYTVAWNGEGENGNYAVAHITADKYEIVLNEEVRTYGWYVYDNCIYYRIPQDPDFYKYDMKTGEKTVLLKDCGFEIIVLSGDTVYTQINAETDTEKANLVSFRPDLSDRKDWTVAYPEGTKGGYFTDVCGDYLVFDPIFEPSVQSKKFNTAVNGTIYEYDPACIVCSMTTGTMRYLQAP